MGQKRINDLDARSDFDITCALPVDDASQSWKVTGSQIQDFINALITLYSNTSIEGYAATATAAGTTTLIATSKKQQFFTGVTTQTVVLPDATTLTLGQSFVVTNLSTGVVTVNKNGGTLVKSMPPNSVARFVVTNIGSAAGSWTAVPSTLFPFVEGYTTTATAASTTTLTVTSTYQQFFTGSSTQTVVLPDCTTLDLGKSFEITNLSTGAVTVNKNGGTLVKTLAPNSSIRLTCTNVSSAAGAWTGDVKTLTPFNEQYTTTATAAGTTTLTATSTYQQFFTGTSTQTVTLPDATTLDLGKSFEITNLSTGAVTINKNGGTLVKTLAPNSSVRLTVTNIGSAAGSWNVDVKTLTPFNEQYTTTATAAGTTTLTVTSTYQQFFTGTSTQTVTLPDCTTLDLGKSFKIVNLSTGAVTVNKNGGTLAQYLAPNSAAEFICTNIGSAAGAWTVVYVPFTRQVAVGSAQTSDGSLSNAAFTDFTNQPTITFTALFTGKYRIYCDTILSESSTSSVSVIRLNNSAGGASITFSQEASMDKTANTKCPAQVYMIASLTAGTSYTFTLQGKISTGTLTLVSSSPTNGIAIVAEQIE